MREIGHVLLSCLIGLLLTIGIWGGVSFWSDAERLSVERWVKSEDSGLAVFVDEHVASQVRSLDRVLLHLRKAWLEDRSEFAERVEEMVASVYSELVFQVGIVDADGLLVHADRGHHPGAADVSDRDYFRLTRDRGEDGLAIGRRSVGQIAGGLTMVMARPILEANGRFAGAVLLWVDPEQLLRSFRGVDLGPGGGLVVVGTDGRTRVCTGVARQDVCPDHFESEAFISALPGTFGDVRIERPPLEPTRTGVYRALRDHPLIVLALRTGEGMAKLTEERLALARSAAGIVSVVVMGGAVLIGVLNGRRARAMERLAVQEERWRLALDAVGDGVWDWNPLTGRTEMTDRWHRLIGDANLGESEDWTGRLHEDDRKRTLSELEEHFAGRTSVFRCEHRLRREGGAFVWVLNRGVVIARDRAGRPLRMIGTLTDISERKAMENALLRQTEDLSRANAKLAELAVTDQLTGIFNRYGFLERAEEEMMRCLRRGGEVSVLLVDIDEFRSINDRFGRESGDIVLRTAVRRIQRHLRRGDIVGRIGGEEFVILLPDTGPALAPKMAEELLRAVDDQPVILSGGTPVVITACIGVACASDTASPFALILGRADAALARAKKEGRNRVVVFRAGETVPAA